MLQASLGRARWTASAEHVGQSLATAGVRLQRSEAAGHNVHCLRIVGQTPRGSVPVREEVQGSAAVGQTGQGAIATGHTACGLETSDQGSRWTTVAGYIAQRPIGYWEAGAGEEGRGWQKARSLAGPRHVVNRGRAAGGLAVGRLAAVRLPRGLLTVAWEPSLVLTDPRYTEYISTAHICRAEGNRGVERNMAGISETP